MRSQFGVHVHQLLRTSHALLVEFLLPERDDLVDCTRDLGFWVKGDY